jgi:glucose/arabinose dehydrogenase
MGRDKGNEKGNEMATLQERYNTASKEINRASQALAILRKHRSNARKAGRDTKVYGRAIRNLEGFHRETVSFLFYLTAEGRKVGLEVGFQR